MNSKERVKKALNLEIPDQIPYGEFSIDFDTVQKILGHETYLRAKAKSQIAFWEGRRDEVIQSWKEDIVELHKKLDCLDIINATVAVPPKGYQPEAPKKQDANTWIDSKGRVYKYSDITRDITMIHDPNTWEYEFNIEDFSKPSDLQKPDESVFEVVDYIVEHFGEEKYILGPSGGEAGMILLGGMERGLTEYLTNPDVVKAAIKRATIDGNKRDFDYIRKGVDAVFWGIDFSAKSGPMMSPELFREFVFPSLKERTKHIHEKFNIPVFKHACGNNWKLMDMFIDIGYDCYQAIQHSAEMNIKDVKEAYGNKICLWGGVSVENLVSGTKEDIIKDVRHAVQYAAKGGGFIMGATHSIAVGSNYDNYMTMLDEFDRLKNCY